MTKEALVQKTNLALEVAKKNVTGNVWGGPPLDALVRLGAKYAPCMRRDRQLYRAIEGDWVNEANNSGCCVRRDTSGCVQMVSDANCVVSMEMEVWRGRGDVRWRGRRYQEKLSLQVIF